MPYQQISIRIFLRYSQIHEDPFKSIRACELGALSPLCERIDRASSRRPRNPQSPFVRVPREHSVPFVRVPREPSVPFVRVPREPSVPFVRVPREPSVPFVTYPGQTEPPKACAPGRAPGPPRCRRSPHCRLCQYRCPPAPARSSPWQRARSRPCRCSCRSGWHT